MGVLDAPRPVECFWGILDGWVHSCDDYQTVPGGLCKWIQEGLDDGVGGCVASGRESVKEVVPVLVYGVRTSQKSFKVLRILESRNILTFVLRPLRPRKILKSGANPTRMLGYEGESVGVCFSGDSQKSWSFPQRLQRR